MAPPNGPKNLSSGWYMVYLPVISHYWGSIFRRPAEFLFPAPRGAGGSQSLKRIKDVHNIFVVFFVIMLFSSSLRIMDRVEQNVLPRTSDAMAMKASFSSDFSMLSIAAAIIAQVAITALALPNLNQVHWTASAGFVPSLVTACISVWLSTTTLLTSLDSPNAIRDWLSQPASKKSRLKFEEEFNVLLNTTDLSSTKGAESI